MDTSEYLRILINEAHLSQAEVAEEIGIAERTLRRYLRIGSEEPPVKVVKAIEGLNCDRCNGLRESKEKAAKRT